jgi:hypothetical protein
VKYIVSQRDHYEPTDIPLRQPKYQAQGSLYTLAEVLTILVPGNDLFVKHEAAISAV